MLLGFLSFLYSVMWSMFVHIKGLQIAKAQSPRQKELLSPTENAAPALPGLELSLCFRMCVTM